MAKLKDRLKTSLDEARILVLGSQVVFGFEVRAAFEENFAKLPKSLQYLHLGATGLMLVAIALLIFPGAYHRLVARGEPSVSVVKVVYGVMDPVLAMFSVALGINAFTGVMTVLGKGAGLAAAIGVVATAFCFFFGLELVQKRRRAPDIERREAMEREKHDEDDNKASNGDKINHALTEARVALPGAQALLGFQFATIWMKAFEELPLHVRAVHLLSMAFIALATILLMAPAAYHRIVERGHMTEHFHKVASALLVAAMVPLALGISTDLGVMVRKVTESNDAAIGAGVATLVVMLGLWFGVTMLQRARRAKLPELREA
ncbi:MAG: DUF6328 family protein [Myxococcaceae bacterium]